MDAPAVGFDRDPLAGICEVGASDDAATGPDPILLNGGRETRAADET
jgi:hypothetical protein